MSTRFVYLAGPITGCNEVQANGWRDDAIERLASDNIRGISPLRCEPLHGERYELTHADPRFGTAKAIASKNFLDVQMCDMTLCYMPASYKLSIGTLLELGWAHALRKPTILVSSSPSLIKHPVVQASASWIVNDLSDGIDICIGILADYSR